MRPSEEQEPRGYAFEPIAVCEYPLLPSVSAAVILAMEGSDRLERIRASAVVRLARVTYVQLNPGRQAGWKPAWVTTSASDIVHAYQNVCAKLRGMGDVLILEDDAELMPDADKLDFASVDAFLRAHRPLAYTLGSVGLCVPCGGSPHCRIGWVFGVAGAQAVIWSRDLRRQLLQIPGSTIPHIDGHFLSGAAPLTYYKPLVVQTFPVTENMATWSLFTSRWLRTIDRACIRAWTALLRYLRLDRDTSHWRTLYYVQRLVPLYIGVFTLVCASSLAVA